MRHRIRSKRIRRLLCAGCASNIGSAAVELAVALPVLVVLVIGVFDMGRLLVTSVTVANAARAGAVWGAQKPANASLADSISQAARDDATDIGNLTVASRHFCRCDGGEVADCTTGDCGAYGQYRLYVEVTASKNVGLVFDYPGLPDSVTITRVATLRVQ